MLPKQRADLKRNTQSSSTARFPGNYSGRQYNGSWISPHPLIFRKYPLKHTVLFSHSQSLVCSVFALHGFSLLTKSMNSVLEDFFRHIITIFTEKFRQPSAIFPEDRICRWDPNRVIYQQCSCPPVCKTITSLLYSHTCIWTSWPFITTTTTH